MSGSSREPRWWREAVIYQIYPRSYRDTNGDGVGDLAGIEARLDHLANLGVDCLWVSPFYPSPMADFGYDVADYTDVDPLFGTLADFDRLLAAAHRRGLKLLMDFVPNHTSDQHPWFAESRASRDDAKRDWYIWRDPAPGGGPPTNWQSQAGGPAWTLDEATGQYYLHTFLAAQPDVNWRNPALREAMLGAMRFWFERGVDGFRLDVVYHCVKDEHFRDDPPNPDYDPARDPPFRKVRPVHSTDQEEVLDLVVDPMRRLAEAMGERLLVGEIYLPFERLVRYYGRDGSELPSGVHLPFNFALIGADWRAEAVADLIQRYESHLPEGGWPNWVLGNHDQARIATRIGPEQARVAAMLLLTLRGTPTIYYGDEIGMEDVAIPPNRVRDPWEINMPGLGEGRDPCRTPMRWSAEPGRGFCAGDVEPWLPFGPDRPHVEEQAGDDTSMLALHRAVIALRRDRAALSQGGYERIEAAGDVLVIGRSCGDEHITVLLNLGGAPAPLPDDPGIGDDAAWLLSTHARDGLSAGDALRPNEGRIVALSHGGSKGRSEPERG
ncbi:MAG: alpha-amylase family glycosyl hydrolase [Pseudomonadota bacterium]